MEKEEETKMEREKEKKKVKVKERGKKMETQKENKKEREEEDIKEVERAKKKGKEKEKEKEKELDEERNIEMETSNRQNVKMTFEVTNRFAVLGCDWDNISSIDVFYLFESYYNFEKEKKKKFDYSKSRAVKRVTIYTSKYGEKKLKYEEEHGPTFDFGYLQRRKNRDAIYRENNFYDLINAENEAEKGKETEKKKRKTKKIRREKPNDKSGKDGDSDVKVEVEEEEEDGEDEEEGEEEGEDEEEEEEGEDEEEEEEGEDEEEEEEEEEGEDEEEGEEEEGEDEEKEVEEDEDEEKDEEDEEEIIRDNTNKGILQLYKGVSDEEEKERIRLYQLQRSRYYFALVECYNKEIVEFLYEELNDMDADFCVNYLDLRIIDDNCSLDDYKVKEVCEKIPLNYKFYYSVSSALKHSNVKSNWDENPRRKRFLSTRFTEEELRELDMKEYLADTESDEDAEEKDIAEDQEENEKKQQREKRAERYRNLLLGDFLDEEKNVDIEKYLQRVESKMEDTMKPFVPVDSKNRHIKGKSVSFNFNEMNESFGSRKGSNIVSTREHWDRNRADSLRKKHKLENEDEFHFDFEEKDIKVNEEEESDGEEDNAVLIERGDDYDMEEEEDVMDEDDAVLIENNNDYAFVEEEEEEDGTDVMEEETDSEDETDEKEEDDTFVTERENDEEEEKDEDAEDENENEEDENEEDEDEDDKNKIEEDETETEKDKEEEEDEEDEEEENEQEKENKEKNEDEEQEGEVAKVFKKFLNTNEKREDAKSPWENFLEKSKQKKKMRRKAYLELKKKRDEEIKNIIRTKPGKVKKENKKNKKKTQGVGNINAALEDDRFTDLFKNKDFNIDITNPRYKKTKFIEKVLKKKA